MKNIPFLFLFSLFVLATSCSTENEDMPTDCYTCTTTDVEYCYTVGNSYYTATDNEDNTVDISLNGFSWSITKTTLTNQCNGINPIADCYTCTATGTEYCYTTGNSYYSTSINGDTPTNIELNGDSWLDLRNGFVTNCDSSNVNASIVGTWKAIDYRGTSLTETLGTSSTISSTFQGTSYNDYLTIFTENPNKVSNSGSINIHMNINNNGTSSEMDQTITSDPTDVQSWILTGTNLEITTAQDFDEYINTVLELTDTTLKLKINAKITITQSGLTNKITDEVFITYERQ